MKAKDYGPRYYAVNGREMTMMEWSRAFSHYRHIGDDYLRIRGRIYRVSTVWLGLDHGWLRDRPLIFETMVFKMPQQRTTDLIVRYSTLREAQRGHLRMVRLVKRIVRAHPKPKPLIHNGHKPTGRRTTVCRK